MISRRPWSLVNWSYVVYGSFTTGATAAIVILEQAKKGTNKNWKVFDKVGLGISLILCTESSCLCSLSSYFPTSHKLDCKMAVKRSNEMWGNTQNYYASSRNLSRTSPWWKKEAPWSEASFSSQWVEKHLFLGVWVEPKKWFFAPHIYVPVRKFLFSAAKGDPGPRGTKIAKVFQYPW